MQLRNIQLQNFRNYENLSASFSPQINCFFGKNGSGKTNLLDAIHILCLSKSHITHLDKENIKHLQTKCLINGTFIKNDFNDKIQCIIEENKKKILKKNGKQYEKISDHIGVFPLVVIAPSDIFLLLNNRKLRLKLIDNIISQTNNKYLNYLIKYNKLLENRNSVLKHKNESCQEMINVYDQELAKYGSYIANERLQIINELTILLSNYYQDISNRNYYIQIKYETEATSYAQYLQKLVAKHNTDLTVGYSTFGIHRDDVIFTIDGYAIQKFASQGQQKSFIIALKLSQYHYIKKTTKVSPILLLDDILDKLDIDRIKNLLKYISSHNFGQTFITNTNKNDLQLYLNENDNTKFFLIQEGTIIDYLEQKII